MAIKSAQNGTKRYVKRYSKNAWVRYGHSVKFGRPTVLKLKINRNQNLFELKKKSINQKNQSGSNKIKQKLKNQK